MKYFVKTAEGENVGPYTLSEVVNKFGDSATLIPADNAEPIPRVYKPESEKLTRPSYPTQLELPKMPTLDGRAVLAAIAFSASLLGALCITFGFFASWGQPREYQLTHTMLGLLGLLINACATLVSICALIVRPSIVPGIALVIAMLSSAAFILIPPQTRPSAPPSTQNTSAFTMSDRQNPRAGICCTVT